MAEDEIVTESPIEILPTGAFRLNVVFDEADFWSFDDAIRTFAEMDRRIPQPQHDDATLTGCVLAEILRDWLRRNDE